MNKYLDLFVMIPRILAGITIFSIVVVIITPIAIIMHLWEYVMQVMGRPSIEEELESYRPTGKKLGNPNKEKVSVL